MPTLNQLVGVLKAASEPTRLRILSLMAEGELSVKDLTEILDQSQPRVSRHLKLLADAGLASRHAEGAWAYYGLVENTPQADLVRRLVRQLDGEDGTLQRDQERLRRVRETHAEEAARYFATVAESWDRLRSLHVPEAEVERAIVAVASGRKIDRLVDLGTGTGRMLELLADHYRHGTGIDSSREMISLARAKLAAANIGHAQVRLADISDMEATGPADLVVLHQVLHYFDDPGKILGVAARMLAAGGAVIVADFAPHDLEFLRQEQAHRRLGLSQAQMEGWARQAGLVVEESREFPNPSDPEGLTVCLWVLTPQTREERVQA